MRRKTMSSLMFPLFFLTGLCVCRADEPGVAPAWFADADAAFVTREETHRIVIRQRNGENPLTIDLTVSVGGQGYRTRWADHFLTRFSNYDLNHDGTVDLQEFDPKPINARLGNLFAAMVSNGDNGSMRNNGGKPAGAARTSLPEQNIRSPFVAPDRTGFPSQGVNTPGAWLSALERIDPPFALVRPNRFPSPIPLIPLLDRNKDGRLQVEECVQAAGALAWLDTDEDGRLIPKELLVRHPLMDVANPRSLPAGFVNRDWFPSDLGPEFSTKSHDADGATLRLAVALPHPSSYGSRNADRRTEKTANTHNSLCDIRFLEAPASLQPRRLAPHVLAVTHQAVRWDVFLAEEWEFDPKSQHFQIFRFQFLAMDTNQDGVIRVSENAGLVSPELFRGIDANHDECFNLQEWDTFWDRMQTDARHRVEVRFIDENTPLFGWIDRNHDLRLDRRELEQLRTEAPLWDVNNDGVLQESEIPRTISIGISPGTFRYPEMPVFSNIGLSYERRLPPPPGPNWFQAMDLNRDGAVQHNEFVGPIRVFQSLDVNKDQAISVQEAEQRDH